jgi:hypothetical protein
VPRLERADALDTLEIEAKRALRNATCLLRENRHVREGRRTRAENRRFPL